MNKLISEDDIYDTKLNKRKEIVSYYQEKEQFFNNLPYADEQIRIPYYKFVNCKTYAARISFLATGLSIFGAIAHSRNVYGI